jgi:RNA polymerase sigma-70 factor (ECF subfamily)
MDNETINFQDLYRRYAQDVYRFAYWLSNDANEAEDITSETFVRALTASGRLRAETVKGYLLTIARNLYLHNRRANQRITKLEDEIHDQQPAPEKYFIDQSRIKEVFQALAQLPEVDRAAFILRVQDELSYSEIAIALNISPAAAKVKVCRTRLKLASLNLQVLE